MIPRLCTAIGITAVVLTIRPAMAQDGQRHSTGPEPAYAMVTTSARHVRDQLTFELIAPRVRAQEWVVYLARLPELPSQTQGRSALSQGGRPTREFSAAGRPVLFTRIPVRGSRGRDGVTIRVEYEANLLTRRLVRREPGAEAAPVVAPLAQKERRLELAEGHQFDYRSPYFQGWLDTHKLRREPNEAEIDFARRAFLEIKGAFRYLEGAGLDHLASHACEARGTDSGGLSIVFASVLRAGGIPARVASGRRLRDPKPGEITSDEPHVRAEFFATGVGWVPVDIGCAMVLDKSPEGLKFFGADNADFLTLHLDTDLDFDTVFFGRKTVEFVQAPAFWVSGSGTLDDFKLNVTSRVEAEPVNLSRPQRTGPTRKSQEGKK